LPDTPSSVPPFTHSQMGSDHSKGHKSPSAAATAAGGGAKQQPPSPPAKAVSPIWQQRLHLLTDGANELTRAHFDQFGDDYGDLLWEYFTEGDRSTTVSLDRFAHKATPLFGSSTDVYVKIAGGGENLLRISSGLVDCAPNEETDEIYQNVLQDMKSFGDDWNAAVEWKHAEAARAADPLQLRFHAAFSTIPVPSVPASHIVSPFCMFFLRAAIPPSYLPPQNTEWSILYSSVTSGMSTSRFESCVFGYKSRTLTLMRTGRGLFAIGADQEWRHSLSPFGGADAFCMRLSPGPIARHTGASSLHCNLKVRASKMGISWKGGVDLDLDKDLSQVLEMEVWACGGSKHLEEHAKLKVWQKNQTEKLKKVPLPGNWDDNADKTILEMAGFQFSNERNNDPKPEERRE
ncbi:hypothetical protein PENTCL1PPCAC_10358, partial [Pristionchus entomophagus]